MQHVSPGAHAVVRSTDTDRMYAYEAADPHERDRPSWYGEMLFRMQHALDRHISNMESYREGGVHEVEVLSAGCCSVCEAVYPPASIAPIESQIVIPVPGCVNPVGCICCATPVVHFGEV
jgi:hypothetical protein